MTPDKLILTSALLGVFTLMGGCYGVLLSLAKIQKLPAFGVAAHVCYVAQCAAAIALVTATPLLVLWKLLIVASCASYYFIPPMTLRYLTRLHDSTESRSC